MISLSTLSIFVIPRCYDKYVPGIVVVHRTLTAELVCAAVENRGVPQDSQIWLQGGGIQTAQFRKTGEPARHLLYHRVANFLAGHAAPAEPAQSPAIALTPTEVNLLDELVKTKSGAKGPRATVSDYIIKIARLGGYLARAADPPPGNRVMWRGLTKLNDIHLGFLLAAKLVGN
jgi:hypothetical protein